MSPSRKEFSSADGGRFKRFGYPNFEQIGEDLFLDESYDDCINFYSEYIDETKAIFNTNETRILKVELNSMKIEGDLLLHRNREPESGPPDQQQYEGRYYLDLFSLHKFRQFIVTYNRRRDDSAPRQMKYSLTFYRIEDILADW